MYTARFVFYSKFAIILKAMKDVRNLKGHLEAWNGNEDMGTDACKPVGK